jgi:type I restriction enzyme, R subunit
MNHFVADSNFHFLQQEFPLLANLAQSAEQHLHAEPVVALFKLRQFVEKMADLLFELHRLPAPYPNDLHHRLLALKEEDILPGQTTSLLFKVKSSGNRAVHENKGTAAEALAALSAVFHLAKWLAESYGEQDYPGIAAQQFSTPPKLDSRHALHVLQQEYERLEQAFAQYQAAQAGQSADKLAALKRKAMQAAAHIQLSEAETRELIDEQLRAAGWEADTAHLRFANGTRPQKGRNLAIAEWRLGGKLADYALFIGNRLVGLIEAKKRQADVISDLEQAKEYARLAAEEHSAVLAGQWGQYQVPFLFSTNSRPYHPQLETKSGIWFLDVRRFNNHPKALRGWFSPADLQSLLDKDEAQANRQLAAEPLDYLTAPDGLNLRYYQLEAIRAVEEQVMRHAEDAPQALVAMATGTGKTRTIIGLCYRLIKSKRFKRILFLVDRTILGSQAADAFNEVVIESALPFGGLAIKSLNRGRCT